MTIIITYYLRLNVSDWWHGKTFLIGSKSCHRRPVAKGYWHRPRSLAWVTSSWHTLHMYTSPFKISSQLSLLYTYFIGPSLILRLLNWLTWWTCLWRRRWCSCHWTHGHPSQWRCSPAQQRWTQCRSFIQQIYGKNCN